MPPGTTLRFCVTFNTNDVGASQTSDFKHPPAVKPRAAQSIDRLPGGPKFLVDATIDNAVFAGGATGLTLSELGIAVPANEFAYLYQLNNMTGQTPLTEFRIYDSAPFSSLIALSFSHDAASSPILLGEGFDLDPDSGVVDSLFPVFEGPGASGFLPVSWAVSGGDIVASFAGLAPGQSSGILVGFSSFAPGLGTVSITDGTNAVTNALFRPVPEPPTLLLVMTSLVALLRYKRLLRRR